MKYALLIMFLATGQASLTDIGPAWRGDPNVRHIPLPGTIEPRLKPIEGFSCRSFVAYNESQTALNILQGGDLSCSGELLDPSVGSFRQLNLLPTAAGLLPVVIHSPPAQIDATSRIVVLLTGGPRAIAVTTPLAKRLVARGFTVLMPLYLGEIETRQPDSDLPGAILQVRALERWADGRLVGTIGISAGAYLAAAACTTRCPPRVLLAPPLTTPAESYADRRIDWSKTRNDICLWRQGGPQRVCADEKSSLRSFWGDGHYHTRLSKLLKGRCDLVRIVVSPDDTRVYNPRGVSELRRIGCVVETPFGLKHKQMDTDQALNDHTIDLIAKLGKRVQNRQTSVPK